MRSSQSDRPEFGIQLFRSFSFFRDKKKGWPEFVGTDLSSESYYLDFDLSDPRQRTVIVRRAGVLRMVRFGQPKLEELRLSFESDL